MKMAVLISGLCAVMLSGAAAQRGGGLSKWDPSMFQAVAKGNGIIALPVEVQSDAAIDFGATLDAGNTLVGVQLFAKVHGEPTSDGDDWTRCETSGAMACGGIPVSFGNARFGASDYGTTYQIRAIPRNGAAFRARMVLYFKHTSYEGP